MSEGKLKHAEDIRTPSGTSSNVIIEIQKLNKHYSVGNNTINALRDVNLRIHSTDFVIIFGPSGCGKSTLLNVIAGLDTPSSGSVEVRDTDLFSLEDDKRGIFRSKKMGIIHQMPQWIKSLNVIYNIALPLIIEGVKEKHAILKAENIMSDLKITDLALQKPNQLSGGQQQKASLARALVSNPWIILADEPTGNLDSASSDEIMGIFDYLNKKYRRTIILVTHNQAYWNLGTNRVEMKDGEIIKQSKHINEHG